MSAVHSRNILLLAPCNPRPAVEQGVPSSPWLKTQVQRQHSPPLLGCSKAGLLMAMPLPPTVRRLLATYHTPTATRAAAARPPITPPVGGAG